jgi:hypothetical protein
MSRQNTWQARKRAGQVWCPKISAQSISGKIDRGGAAFVSFPRSLTKNVHFSPKAADRLICEVPFQAISRVANV